MKYPNLADVLDTAAPGIDHSKVLSYGCQCQFLDGRPLVSVSAKISSSKVWAFFEIWNKAAAGNGHPVDEIDAACKQLGYLARNCSLYLYEAEISVKSTESVRLVLKWTMVLIVMLRMLTGCIESI